MPEPMTWEELRQLWTALGYTQLSFSQAAQKEFPGVKGLSQPRISRQLSRDRHAPVPTAVGEWAVSKLKPLPGAEKGYAAFRRAIASSSAPAKAKPAPKPNESGSPPERQAGPSRSGGMDARAQPPSSPEAATPESRMNISIPGVSTNEDTQGAGAANESGMNISILGPTPDMAASASQSTIATPSAGVPAGEAVPTSEGAPAVVVQFEPSQVADVAKKTVTEMLAQLPKPVDSSEVVKQAVTELIAQLPKPADSSEVAKMAAPEAVVQQPKLPDPSEVAKQVVHDLRPYFVLTGVLLLTGFVGLAVRGRHAAEAPSSPTCPVIVNVGTGLLNEATQRLAPKGDNALYIFGARPLGVGRMGEKAPAERYIPKTPLPGQKLAPNCDPEAGESTFNGGCWGNMGDKRPPCGPRLFRNGDKCYAPVAADPNVPVSSQPE